jgi:hypothetical protein
LRTNTQWKLMKAQQKRPKMEERRAFENLLAHFECAENPSCQSKKWQSVANELQFVVNWKNALDQIIVRRFLQPKSQDTRTMIRTHHHSQCFNSFPAIRFWRENGTFNFLLLT